MKFFAGMVILAVWLPAMVASGTTTVHLALNWKPEPEFGGFYAAQASGAFTKHGLNVTILPGGVGTPVVQMVGAGKVEFGIASADEVVMARARGADVVAIFAVYQTSPQAIMAHEELGIKTLKDVFETGTVALQKGLPYALYLEKKFGSAKAKLVPFLGGIAQFLGDKKLAQQCFVTAEPLEAQRKGQKAKVFLVADAGYNPYTTVVITKGSYVRGNPKLLGEMRAALVEGWRDYLKDAAPANAVMEPLNPTLDKEMFQEAARTQRALIETEQTGRQGLGTMEAGRWDQLSKQLVDLKLIERALPPDQYFWSNAPKQ